MAKVQTKVVPVDGVWSVVVYDNKEQRLYHRDENNAAKNNVEKVDATVRKMLNNVRPTIRHFDNLPIVYTRFSTRKKIVLTVTPP